MQWQRIHLPIQEKPLITSSVPGLGRSPGEGNDNPLQYSCLGNPKERSLVGYSPQDHKESDTTEQAHTLSLILFQNLKIIHKAAFCLLSYNDFFSHTDCTNCIIILTLAYISPLKIFTNDKPWDRAPPSPMRSFPILLYLLYGTFHYLQLLSACICLYTVCLMSIQFY